MLVGAIGLLAGDRADASVVRPGAEEATVQGRFVVDGDEVVLTRVVPRTGRSRAYRDGRLITAAELAELAAGLVDLHGQHAHVGLLTTASQRRALDRFAGVDLHDLEAARRARRTAGEELDGLGGDAAARDRERDFLRFQLDEIEAAGLTDDGEDERLLAEESDPRRRRCPSRCRAPRPTRPSAPTAALATGWPPRSAELGERAPFAAVVARLRAVEADLADVAHELRAVAEGIEGDPERLAAVQERRAQLGRPAAALPRVMPARRSPSSSPCGTSSPDGSRSSTATPSERRRRRRTRGAGATRRWPRRPPQSGASAATTPRPWPTRCSERLHELALAKAEVRLEVGDDRSGRRRVVPARPQPRAARRPRSPRRRPAASWPARCWPSGSSSGRACPPWSSTRWMPASAAPAARSVGRALAALADDKQVLVVTHLPQVAAFADAQIALTKHDDGATTVMRAEVLAAEPRVRELARMLSGAGRQRHRSGPRRGAPRHGRGGARSIVACCDERRRADGRRWPGAPRSASARRTSPSAWSPATSP